uniref:Uncharacterized protein n=1 Tax=Musa acuminata subsp. malaccensis TaxID=214687 RepID=A0A804KTB3_MUSAM
MKNVAKCDTWCELHNPVNHRVFERKLSYSREGAAARFARCSPLARTAKNG